MATNKFRVKKGLIVEGSGSVILDVQGSQGQLFSITDQLTGSLFSVNDISGLPILEVTSDDTVTMGTFGAEALTISGSNAYFLNGNVGIGTTSIPNEAKLFVDGQLKLSANLDGTDKIGWGPSANNIRYAWISPVNEGSQNVGLALATTTVAGEGIERMRITHDGNVGIGTSSPIDKFHVAGGISSTGLTNSLNGSIGSIQIGYDGTNGVIRTWNSSPLIYSVFGHHQFNTNNTERLRITSSGNVLIGTTTDNGQKLQVNGNVSATSFIGALSGNSTTATTLQTARTINGTSFNGSANITTANWGTARTITIGSTGKSVNGSANVSWSLAEIGAYSSAGGNLTGPLTVANRTAISVAHWSSTPSATGAIRIKLPGTHTGNWSMLVLRITAYEYTTNAHTVYYVSGHDWTSGWYNNKVTKIGSSNKSIRLGYDGTANEDYVVLGDVASSWSYGHVTVDVMSHPSFYSGNMDISTGWSISLVTSLTGVTLVTPTEELVWHSQNDGSGSGLDADLLDGNHASAFYLASNPSGYTTNTGTVTSVSGTGGYGGLTLSGTVTTSGNITLGGTPTGTWPISVSGNAATATSATTATSAATWTTARTLTIGSTGKSVNGSANVSWSLAEIGAQAAGNYVTADTTQTISGAKTFSAAITHNSTSTRDKYRVWSAAPYSIGMGSSYTFGAINNDYAMTFQMNNASARGFWWGDDGHTNAQGAMALSTNGYLTVANGIRAGYGESDTTVPTWALDVSGNARFLNNLYVLNDGGLYYDASNRVRLLTAHGWEISSWSYTKFIGNIQSEGQIYSPTNAKGNSGTAVTFNWNDGNIQTVTMTGNATFTFSNPQSGASYQIIITQDATGSRTITWPTIKWKGGAAPTLTGTANSIDIVTLTYDGTNYYGTISKNHA